MAEENLQTEDLAYDLRQRYAKIVGDHLEDIAYFRKLKDYPNYFNSLVDLYTIIEFKFKERKTSKSKPSLKLEVLKQLVKEFDDLENDIIKISNNNIDTWLGKSQDTTAIAQIEGALRTIERYLYYKMNEANMFGSKREIEGLI